MTFDLDQRTARLGVGELAEFNLGPREPVGGPSGAWRAQLGMHWHREFRAQAQGDHPGAEFEVAVEGSVFHRGWMLHFGGRIDQVIRGGAAPLFREIKTVAEKLPAPEPALRAAYAGYFAQAAAYLALRPEQRPAGELVFVEVDTGLSQTVALTEADQRTFQVQLERVTEFLELRLRARSRLSALRFQSPFPVLRPGQETVQGDLEEAFAALPARAVLEAPTGFGKTGALLEFALGQLRLGRFERVLYLTSKSTGQLQVRDTLEKMTARPEPAPAPGGALAVWLVRPKSEHCVNSVFHCVRESCRYLEGMEERWPESGLARFYLFEDQPRDLPALRAAGREARICPYEITRAALAANDVWIGDYNYVFSPSASGLFYAQPGFDASRTLLLVDEAHNLPSRVADAFSQVAVAERARAVGAALEDAGAAPALAGAWDRWVRSLERLHPVDALPEDDETLIRGQIAELADAIATTPVDYAALGPGASEGLWQVPALVSILDNAALPRLCWCPRPGTLAVTCLDAAAEIGARLREFGGAILATATPGPLRAFTQAVGLDESEPPLVPVRAATPWRDGAYDVAFDLRVDTTFQHRVRHHPTTARTLEAFAAGSPSAVAAFFSSYGYAEAIVAALREAGSDLRVAVQPRGADLSAQAAWMEEALESADALFLVLGSSFAESIDLLGGRVERALVVGSALPEVNAVQQARMAALAETGRDAAFQRVYQIPGMQKVNQALGRLVRAPGQKARILLHCRRFAEPAYARLLAPEYQSGPRIRSEETLEAWLAGPRHEDL
ncbi:MAG TPA: helicase C-terminal domain-containing protein [Opitutaceae bacterium]|nr:helicase C-terminal domain-containing protein [Opitutaceae bacterium]